MKCSTTSRKLIWLMISGIIIAVDQMSKLYMMMTLEPNTPSSVTSFINFTYTENKGIAFSLFNHSHDVMHMLVTLVAFSITVFLIRWFWRLPLSHVRAHYALVCIIGGATGNLLDRLILGHVRDFFHFYINDWHFAIFNFADAMITIGAILMIIDVIFAPVMEDNQHGQT